MPLVADFEDRATLYFDVLPGNYCLRLVSHFSSKIGIAQRLRISRISYMMTLYFDVSAQNYSCLRILLINFTTTTAGRPADRFIKNTKRGNDTRFRPKKSTVAERPLLTGSSPRPFLFFFGIFLAVCLRKIADYHEKKGAILGVFCEKGGYFSQRVSAIYGRRSPQYCVNRGLGIKYRLVNIDGVGIVIWGSCIWGIGRVWGILGIGGFGRFGGFGGFGRFG